MVTLAKRLADIVDASRVVVAQDDLEPYARDESGLDAYYPQAAVLAQTAGEIRDVLAFAGAERLPVTPRGLGSGMTGGALPVAGGIVLSTERMTRIVDIDTANLTAVVEPGVVTGEFQTAVEAEGLFYPPDPASLAYCSLGGNVAENAGGPRAFKYGVTREYVLGAELSLMGGETFRVGKRTIKGVTGYDLTGCVIGSEGTMGVFSELTLKLLPKPQGVATFLAHFDDVITAGEAVAEMIRKGHRPRTLELIDPNVVEHLRLMGNGYGLPAGRFALLLVELDGQADGLDQELAETADACQRAGASDILVATDESRRRQLWEMRRNASPSLKERHKFKTSEDIVVPRAAIPEMLRRLDRLAAEKGVMIASFGHAGDGNLHVNVLFDDAEKAPLLDGILEQIFRDTVQLGGTLSGEHGIGLTKKKFMHLEQPSELMALQKKLKQTFDPQNLLNPGKIFPDF